jgi:hypothetical protein
VERSGGSVDKFEEVLNWHVVPLLRKRAYTGAMHFAG